MYTIGTGKADITAYYKGASMLGYGMYFNTMEAIETPLSARAVIVKWGSKKLCFVNCELGFITISIRNGVLGRLQKNYPAFDITEDNLMLTAQHTHSAPGGYSFYQYYNIPTPGFVKEIYEKIVNGIIEAIVAAESNYEEGTIEFGKGEFELDKEVSFNRSIKAYNANKDVTQKINDKTRNLGTDRQMLLLKFKSKTGKELACINWFGVHTTSISNDNHKVCADNKGFASTYFEEQKAKEGSDNFVAIFAQGSCGDVSPKFIHNPKHIFPRGNYEGKFPDDIESAKYNGKLQKEKAEEIYNGANQIVSENLDSVFAYTRFTDIQCDPKFADGKTDAITSPACLGTSFFGGAIMDGPGMHPILLNLVRLFVKGAKVLDKITMPFKSKEEQEAIKRKFKAQGVKDVLSETTAKKVFMTTRIDKLIVPSFLDPSIESLKTFYQNVKNSPFPWTAEVLPLQIFILGELAIVGVPFELTVVAGRRLQKTMEEALKDKGITQIILSPYANGYSGYITTYEEYQVQMYEGGHTVFGEYSLAALQTKLDALAKEIVKPENNRNIQRDMPPQFTEQDLEVFSFYKRKWYIKNENRISVKK